jgi:predicted ATPase
MRQIVPGLEEVLYKDLGPRETLEFRQRVGGQKHSWRFFASSMSDGTLRALGVLSALFQRIENGRNEMGLVSIEEPESTINPGVAAVLMDALLEASKHRQILITTHSPDLLDHHGIEPENLRIVANIDGKTVVSMADPASVETIKAELHTAGELLRLRQLEPDPADVDASVKQLVLFD